MNTVAESYLRCAKIARQASSSFYLSFWLLPKPKRDAMFALYAFSRRSDDLTDGDEPLDQKRSALSKWRRSLEASLGGDYDCDIMRAVADAVDRYSIPPEYLFDVIDGVEMDLSHSRYQTFDDLHEYCRRVASAVGLACLHIWGFEGSDAYKPANACGVAFQITNILRDIREDCLRERVYLPLEDFARFDYSVEALMAGDSGPAFDNFIGFQIDRASRLYDESRQLAAYLDSDGRRMLSMMTQTYRTLLEKIANNPAAVLKGRVSISRISKAWIAGTHLLLPAPKKPDGLL